MGYTYVPANPAWDWVVANMGTVPVVALGLGSVAGLGAARLVTSHYSVMVEGTSHMFIAGPPVVARAGRTVTKEELGGSDIHARSGAVDDVVASEAEAFARARRFLSYLPPSVYELPERIAPSDDPARREPWLIEAIPQDRRKVYDMRRIVRAVVDTDVRDGQEVRRPGHHRAGAARRLAGRRAGERSLLLRRRLDCRCLAESRALR
jgi:acetyl-CoA carboxylase carboxyltransferase component